MPYKSKAQAAYFHIHKKELEKKGVDVDEWDKASKGKKLPKKTKKKYQFAGSTNPCGPGTQWDANSMQCIPIPANPNLDPVFQMNNIGNPTNFNEEAFALGTGRVIDSNVIPLKNNTFDPTAGAIDARGNFVPQQKVIGDAIDKGFNYDSDDVYRKAVETINNNILEYSDPFKALNIGLNLTQGVAGVVNDAKTKKQEKYNLLKARYNRAYYNPYEQGLNNVPAYFQNGGQFKPIIVTNPNDKKLKAYQDSLVAYNKGKQLYINKFYKTDPTGQGYDNNDDGTWGTPYDGAWINGVKPIASIINIDNRPVADIYKKPVQPVWLNSYMIAKEQFKSGGSIEINYKHKGLFTKEAKVAGMSVQEFAKHVLANKDRYSPAVVKRANFAKNFAHQNGGYINNTGYLPQFKTSQNPYNIIPSNNITMNGVPQDLLAIPNVGKPQIMPANSGKYKFPNASHVIEIPVNKFQNGGYRDYDCPNGDCYDKTPIIIPIPQFLQVDPSKRALRKARKEEEEYIKSGQYLIDRAGFYKNNIDYGKYPVINWDPQPQKDGVIYYGPSNFTPTGSNDVLPSPDLYAQTGGHFQYGGLDQVESQPQGNAEVEEGEVIQQNTGKIVKAAEGSGTHEEGGNIQPNVSRVLEDTADKRKDKNSKLLRITPTEALEITGFKPKTIVSHSKLYEQATDFYSKKLRKFEKKLNDNLAYIKDNGGQYAENSLEQNLKLLSTFPTEAELFDKIYNHQEAVKNINNIMDNSNKKVGGFVPKFQNGSSKKDAIKLDDTKGWDFIGQEGNKKYYRKKGTSEIKTITGYNTVDTTKKAPFTVDDILNHPERFSTFAENMEGAPEDVKRKAAEDLFYHGIMPYKYNKTVTTPDQYGYIDLPATPGVNNRPTVNTRYNTPGGINASEFNMPLKWYDVAGNIANYLSSAERIPVSFEQLDREPLRVHELNPQPALDANTGDFNAALEQLPNNGVGFANQANLLANKYKVNNEIVGQYANQNATRYDQVDAINNNNKFQLDQLNLNLRDRAVQQQLQGMEVERQSKLNAFDDYLTKLAQNAAFNRNGNLILQLTPYFNQEGKFNGNQYIFRDKGNGNAEILDKKTGKVVKTITQDGFGATKQVKTYVRQ